MAKKKSKGENKTDLTSTFVGILQSRMDKCTREQWGAVASVSTLNAFVVVQRAHLRGIPERVFETLVLVAALYALRFIWHRHQAYYNYRQDLVELVRDCKGVPPFLRRHPNRRSWQALSGVLFYMGWVVSLSLIAILA